MTDEAELLWPSSAGSRRGPKPKLTVPLVVEAAIAIADADGLAAVTMQAVAERLGATKMALYRYVPSKSALTALMVDSGLGPPGEETTDAADWRAGLRSWTLELHRRFAHQPWSLELTVGARVIGPNELSWFEAGLVHLARTPLTGAERLDVLAVLSGHARAIVQQQVAAGDPEGAMSATMARIIADNADRFPEVARAFAESGEPLGDAADDGRDQALEFGIARILDGVESLVVSRAGVGGSR